MSFDHYQLAEILGAAQWKFAKTMQHHPHFYTLRKTWSDQGLFDSVVQSIRDIGYDKRWGSRTYRYCTINGFDYWSMGAPIPDTILINRAESGSAADAPYDAVADRYDGLFETEAARAESVQWFAEASPTGRILDIGCGTGLALDILGVPPENYVGVDPSAMMLKRLKVKHPGHAGSVVHSCYEDFYGRNFDSVIAMFGAASYVDRRNIRRVRSMLNPGGTAFLMFYAPGYEPVTYGLPFETAPERHPTPSEAEVRGNYALIRFTA